MDWIGKNWPAALIIIFYTVGLIGFLVPGLQNDLAGLTWANLLMSFVLLLYAQERTSGNFWLSIIIIGVTGYFLEVIGVKSGLLFGEYSYGKNLGLKSLDVPWMIAINWILLVYLSNYIGRKIFNNQYLVIVLAALLMTGLDVLIEPFAIRFDLWSWMNHHVPMQNYIMWFFISLGMNFLYQKLNPKIVNPAAIPLAICMALFFLLIDLLVIWT